MLPRDRCEDCRRVAFELCPKFVCPIAKKGVIHKKTIQKIVRCKTSAVRGRATDTTHIGPRFGIGRSLYPEVSFLVAFNMFQTASRHPNHGLQRPAMLLVLALFPGPVCCCCCCQQMSQTSCVTISGDQSPKRS